MNGFQAVHEVILEEIHAEQQFPPILHDVIDLFGKAHLYFRTFKQVQLFHKASQNTAKGHPAVYGAAMHLLGDTTSLGSYAVSIALITKCAEDLLREYRNLGQTYQNLRDSFRWSFPLYRQIEWKQRSVRDREFFSPYLHVFWHATIETFVKQAIKVTQCALKVLWQAFKLSMCLQDAYLLLNGNPQARYEACTELIGNWEEYQSQLKDDQKRLLEEMQKGCALADRILSRLGIAKNSHSIIETLKNKCGNLSENTEEFIEDLGTVAEETVDIMYIKGKITPLHIDLSEGQNFLSALPQGRFPPWAGQNVEIDLDSAFTNPIKGLEEAILENVPLPGLETVKGFLWMVDRINGICHELMKDTGSKF